MSETDGSARAADIKEATKHAEALLGRAFGHLKECVADNEGGLGSFFPMGVNQIDIRVSVRVSDAAGVMLKVKVQGNEPSDESADYDEFEEDLMFEDE